MNGSRFALLPAAFAAAMAIASCAHRNPNVTFVTDLGEIKVEIFEKTAPVTAANFLKYVDRGLYGDSAFYRTVTMQNQPDNKVRIEVIQGGLGFEEQPGSLPPIDHETTARTGLKHLDGSVSMARAAPGTASSEFFICIGDQPELDFGGKRNPDGQGFAVFGKVLAGMDVVREIHARPAEGQMLSPPVRIKDITRSP